MAKIDTSSIRKLRLNKGRKAKGAPSYYMGETLRVLTREEERFWISIYQDKEMDDVTRQHALDFLVKHNIRLVLKVCCYYTVGPGLMNDIVHNGVIGLITAIKKFDLSRGLKLSTFAVHYIKKYISESDDLNSSVRLPKYLRPMLNKIRRFKRTYFEANGHMPSDTLVAEHIGKSEFSVKNLKRISTYKYPGMSANVSSGGGTVYTEEDWLDPTDVLLLESSKPAPHEEGILDMFLDELDSISKTIILLYYDPYGNDAPLSMESIALRLNLPIAKVNVIHKEAIETLTLYGKIYRSVFNDIQLV